MDGARWERVQSIFHGTVSLGEPERRAFLERACEGDPALIAELSMMLAADSELRSVLDRGLTDVADRIMGTFADSLATLEFGPYKLIRILGEGGMGVVWLAVRADAGNQVAIKFLPHAGLSPARRERFAREIKTLAKLNHPLIARLYDAGTLADGTPWFVMEYVDGVGFTQSWQEQQRSTEEKLRLFRQVCEAVQYAHGQEVIHRDLKPSNIMVANDGKPRLLDFGIARQMQQDYESAELTKPGLRFMSRAYAAPEWVQEGIVGFYTDVYSLGVILYEMLTGRLPFEKSKLEQNDAGAPTVDIRPQKPSVVVRRLAESEQQNNRWPDLSKTAWSDLDVLCLKAMHHDPKERYPSVEALIRDIDHFLKLEPLEARPDSLSYRTGRFVRRNRRAVLAASLALLFVVFISILFTVRLAQARDAAVTEATREKRIQTFMLNLFEGGDAEAGPANNIRVAALLDRGAKQARNLGSEPEVQADLNQTLGTMFEKLGQLDRADDLLQLSLRERQSQSKANPAEIADNLIALGLLRSDQGQGTQAEQLARQALDLIKATEPGNKLHLAKAESALGTAMSADGHQSQAVAVLKSAIAEQSGPGGSATDLSQSLNALADAEMYLGNYTEADSVYRQALALDRRVYGSNHPMVSNNLADLGQVQQTLGNYAEADKLERQALEISEAWYGMDNPDVAHKMTALAMTLEFENYVAQAESMLQKALAITQRTYGPMHPHVAYILSSLGAVAIDRGEYKEAEADFTRMENIYRTAFGGNDYRVAIAMSNLASVYMDEKRGDKAEPLFRQVIQLETKSLGADNINTAVAEIKLGRQLQFDKRYREAIGYTRAGLDTILKQASPSISFIVGARHDLVIDYDALNEPAEAQKFRESPATAQTSTKIPAKSK